MRSNPCRLSSVTFRVTAFLLVVCIVHSANAESISFNTGKTQEQITAITPNIFRISAALSGTAGPRASLFLSPDFKPGDVGHLATVDGHQQLQTDAGALDIDPATGRCSLLDAHGNVLTPPATIATPAATDGRPQVNFHLGWSLAKPFAVYSCGNGDDGLIQHRVDTKVGNGVAVEPFFWSPAGYAAFVVSSDDNDPAHCDGIVDDDAITWAAPGNAADLYLIITPSIGEATQALLSLTGRPPVPPRWTFGYLQSRWGWVDKAYVDDTLRQFKNRKLPIDAFIFDFEWYTTHPDYQVSPEGMSGFSDFDWNAKLFPDPATQLRQLHDEGVHFVGIRKPRLGNKDTLAMIRSKNWGFQSNGYRERQDARGLWFANADVRDWYAQQIEPLLRAGIDGWWNDEGEFTYTNYIYWNMAEQTALSAVRPADRLWTINRAFQPGLARLGATAWTGDIRSSWHDLERTPAALLNWGAAGMPFAACDIGGFSGDETPELLVRWMEAGTFFPIMRAHSTLNDKPHFPWLFGDEAEAAIAKALQLRYQLVPVLYSLAHETHETGQPIMRPLLAQYPTDPRVADLSSEWLIGEDLLAAPVLSATNKRDVFLPDGVWYDFATDRRVEGGGTFSVDVPLDCAPLYVRAGTILTLAPIIQHTRDLPGGPLDVHVFSGHDGRFTLIEDDGATTAYLAGNVRKTTFAWSDADRTLSWSRAGNYAGADCFQSFHVTVHDGQETDATTQPSTQSHGEQSLSVDHGKLMFAR